MVNLESLEIVISHLDSSSSERRLDFIVVFCILLLREAQSCTPWIAFHWWVTSTTALASKGEGRFAACWADFLLSIPLLTRLLEGVLETVLLSSSCLLYLYANFLLLMQYQLDFFVSACSRVCYRHIKVPVGCGPCRKLGWAGDCCCVTRSGEVRKPGSGLSSCAG